jgi:vacuolar protein sorting-associated protein 13A/C
VNYFNIKNSHWEPLVEPWHFKLDLDRLKDHPLTVKLSSTSPLNINLTHTFVQSAATTLQLLDKKRDVG